jgi:hypothetical protein
MLACATGLARRGPTVNLDQGSSVPLGFVFQLPDELTPTDITDSFRKAVVSDHVLDCQTLNANHLVFVDDACRELVLVVSSAVIDPRMDFGDFEACLVAVLRAFLFPGMPSLHFCQLLLILGKIAWIADGRTRGKSDHRLDAQVKTNHLLRLGKRLHVFF